MKNIALILSIFFCLIFCTKSFSKTLEITTLEFPPYVYNEKGVIKGFNVDLLNEISKRMNISVNIKIYPWARAMKMVREGRADAIFPAFKNEERMEFLYFPDGFVTEPIVMFVKKGSSIQYNGELQKMNNYMFGRVRGFSSGPVFDRLLNEGVLKCEDVSSYEINLKKCLANRIDIAIENRFVALYYLSILDKNGELVELKPELVILPSYLAFSKKRADKDLVKKYNKVWHQMKNDGSFQKIIDNFFEKFKN